MLSAKEARKIANSELLQIMNLIRESAYRGGLNIKLDYTLSKNTIGTLEDYGYTVKEGNIPVFEETPYGIIDELTGHKKRTVISWE